MRRRRHSCTELTTPQIGFNYLGRFAAAAATDWAGTGEAGALGGGGDPAMQLAHALEVNALTLDGSDGATLSATWTWAPALLSEQEVRDLAQELVHGAGSAGAPCGVPRQPAAAHRLICRWCRCRRPRSSGWSTLSAD